MAQPRIQQSLINALGRTVACETVPQNMPARSTFHLDSASVRLLQPNSSAATPPYTVRASMPRQPDRA